MASQPAGPYPRTVSVGRANVIASLILLVVALISVILRFYARRRSESRLLQDDWLVLAALLFTGALVGTNVAAAFVNQLVKLQITHVSVSANQISQTIFLTLASGCAKLSLLFLYQRIFSVARVSRKIIFFVVLVVVWMLSFFFAFLFWKWPVSCKQFIHGDCQYAVHLTLITIISGASDFTLDIAILCIPFIYLRKLQMRLEKRVAVATVFGMGIFCTISSIARFGYSIRLGTIPLKPHNASSAGLLAWADNEGYLQMNVWLWSSLEGCTSTICANLPCYAPLIPWGRWNITKRIGARAGFWSRARTSKHAGKIQAKDGQTERPLMAQSMMQQTTAAGDEVTRSYVHSVRAK